jgi:2-dehydro-3-deoxygluconokinase
MQAPTNHSTPKKIVAFGEIMLRLTPADAYERLVKAPMLRMGYAGAESNVAVSLACLGQEAYFVSVLPANALGQGAVNSLREFGVNTQHVVWCGDRIGTYFIEQGFALRPSEVIYDRAASAISQLKPGEMDWEDIFRGKDWFHLSGITPALSESCAEASLEAIRAAKAAGIKVSFDPNYRSKLWSKEAARKTLPVFLPYVDVLLANVGAAHDVFGISPPTGEDGAGEARAVAEELAKLGKFELIAMTIRDHTSASENNYAALLYDGQHFYRSCTYALQIAERLGGGDAFGAGMIHGCCRGWSPQLTVDFATAASALKHTIPGDLNLVTEAEVMRIVEGDLAGRVQR